MAGPTENFFTELSRTGRIPLLARATGSIRFELAGEPGPRHWVVTIDRGDVRVSGEDAEADCVVRTDLALFDEVACGRQNALSAMLRGVLSVEGDPELLVLVQRLLPGPLGASAPLPIAVDGGRS